MSVYKLSPYFRGSFKYFVIKLSEYHKQDFNRMFKQFKEKYDKEFHEKSTFRGSVRHALFIFKFVDNLTKETDDLQRVQTSMTYREFPKIKLPN